MPPVGSTAKICNEETLLYGQGESGEVVAHVESTAVVRMSYGLGCFTVRHLQPLDHDRKAKAERNKFMDAACVVLNTKEINTSIDASFTLRLAIDALFDAGFRLPE